jgi:hypothetical protein
MDPPAAHVIRIYSVSPDFVAMKGDVLGKAASGGFDGCSMPATRKSGYKWQNCPSPQRPHFAPEAIAGGGDPRSMVPVRLAGAEVTEGFWASAAVLS